MHTELETNNIFEVGKIHALLKICNKNSPPELFKLPSREACLCQDSLLKLTRNLVPDGRLKIKPDILHF